MKPSSFEGRNIRQRVERTKKKQFKRAQRRAAAQTGAVPQGKVARLGTRSAPPIELYQKEDCPFSHAVRTLLTELGLDFVAHTVPDDNAAKHKMLVEAGGKDQIPFLVDHSTGVKLYESRAITAYLENEYGFSQDASRMRRMAKSLDRNLRREQDQLVWSLRKPLERARRLRTEIRDTVYTLGDSARVLRDVFKKAVGQ